MSSLTRKIGDVAKVKGGKRLPKGMSVLDEATEHPYLRVVDFADGGIDRSDIKYIDIETFDYIKRYTIDSGDVYISIAGTIGRVGVVPDNLSGANLTENAAKITEISDDVDHRYLMYYLWGPVGQGAIKNRTGGTSQPKLALYKIADIDFPCRPLTTQRRIASILSAYDDLIENNRRRIQVLEQAARLLYKEWFVHLRFPGHEHVTTTDGVPEGWSRVNLNSIIRIEHGYAFKGEYFSEEMSPRILLTPGNFKVGGGIKLDKLKYYSTSGPLDEKNLLKKDDLLITMTDLSKASDTLGYSLLVPELSGKVFLHNQRLGAVYPKENVPFYRHFLDQLFKDFRYRSFVVGSASGTSVKHTSPKKILSYEPVLPSYEKSILIREFDDKVSCMNRQVHNILRTNEKLTLARDLLLPRLMNGKVTP